MMTHSMASHLDTYYISYPTEKKRLVLLRTISVIGWVFSFINDLIFIGLIAYHHYTQNGISEFYYFYITLTVLLLVQSLFLLGHIRKIGLLIALFSIVHFLNSAGIAGFWIYESMAYEEDYFYDAWQYHFIYAVVLMASVIFTVSTFLYGKMVNARRRILLNRI